jgi:hypothetical protein
MADKPRADEPQNIKEFNQITLVVFSKLYVEHPLEKTIDPAEVAAVLGVSPTGNLPSGRPFKKVFEETMRWLHTQGFTNTYGSHASERASLGFRQHTFVADIVRNHWHGFGESHRRGGRRQQETARRACWFFHRQRYQISNRRITVTIAALLASD